MGVSVELYEQSHKKGVTDSSARAERRFWYGNLTLGRTRNSVVSYAFSVHSLARGERKC